MQFPKRFVFWFSQFWTTDKFQNHCKATIIRRRQNLYILTEMLVRNISSILEIIYYFV
jgi:hypothetical protein